MCVPTRKFVLSRVLADVGRRVGGVSTAGCFGNFYHGSEHSFAMGGETLLLCVVVLVVVCLWVIVP